MLAQRMVHFAVNRPRAVTALMLGTTLLLLMAAALPTVAPETFPFMNAARIDTDPENMLAHDEAVRVDHRMVRERFALHDGLVVGVVLDGPAGVFTPETLSRIHRITEFAKGLEGVVVVDVFAPSTVDSVESGGPGVVRFQWLMERPPKTAEEALAVRDRALRIPVLRDTLVSADGRALALYIPLKDKHLAKEITDALQGEIAAMGPGAEDWHVAGLPVAEDTFGVEMFIQMAISAPVAMAVIFLLMWLFFRRVVVIVSPMVVAMVAALSAMALLVISGQTIHIMSSMIPIFVMPIAVLDAVHIISEFFDRYPHTRDRRQTIIEVVGDLFVPMVYTTLTTTAGFVSLALTPIPPVRAFGVFVGAGVVLAWLWTILFVPAFVMLIPERMLEGFGRHADEGDEVGALGARLGHFTWRRSKLILAATVLLLGGSIYGITRIEVNDNPTRWFEPEHPIRVADRVLNSHFGGTYDAYVTFEAKTSAYTATSHAEALGARLKLRAAAVDAALKSTLPEDLDAADAMARKQRKAAEDAHARAGWALVSEVLDARFEVLDAGETPAGTLRSELDARRAQVAAQLSALKARLGEVAASAPADAEAFRAKLSEGLTGAASTFVASSAQDGQIFKRPEVLAWVEAFQAALVEAGGVGKSNALPDIVKTVHRDLLGGQAEHYRLPATAPMVAQTLEQYMSSHRKDDLWHFVTPSYDSALVWMQLRSGDNRDVEKVVAAANAWLAEHPPPIALQPARWSGLSYINVVWQQKMVTGMLEAFIGSFIVVLLMMMMLFRSALWGLLSMVPLTVTVLAIYGALGIAGKDYDMPVAVLSSLSLGLAVDYAIHFMARARALQAELGSWALARRAIFGEPARAIARNIVVVGVGFLPLLLAPLVPYQTVGMLIAAILIAAGAASLIILPALIALLEPWLFPKTSEVSK